MRKDAECKSKASFLQDIVFPVEFIIGGTPVSLQGSAHARQVWKELVKEASYDGLPEQHIVYDGGVGVSILHFPAAEMMGDIDNIVKPILDALCKHIYFDDRQVVRVVAHKIELDQPVTYENPSNSLITALGSERPFTYVRISDNPYGVSL